MPHRDFNFLLWQTEPSNKKPLTQSNLLKINCISKYWKKISFISSILYFRKCSYSSRGDNKGWKRQVFYFKHIHRFCFGARLFLKTWIRTLKLSQIGPMCFNPLLMMIFLSNLFCVVQQTIPFLNICNSLTEHPRYGVSVHKVCWTRHILTWYRYSVMIKIITHSHSSVNQ